MQHVIQRAQLEATGEKQQAEAWYKELSDESRGQQHSTMYRSLYLQWLQQPMAAHAAYLQRAIMNIRAKCYLQVTLPFLLLNMSMHSMKRTVLAVHYCCCHMCMAVCSCLFQVVLVELVNRTVPIWICSAAALGGLASQAAKQSHVVSA